MAQVTASIKKAKQQGATVGLVIEVEKNSTVTKIEQNVAAALVVDQTAAQQWLNDWLAAYLAEKKAAKAREDMLKTLTASKDDL